MYDKGYVSSFEKETEKLCKQWEDEIYELTTKEVDLLHKKQLYVVQSEIIIQETDFKELYGKNNDKVRRMHVDKELKGLVDDINNLELSIDYLKRHISLLKTIVRLRL